MSKHNDYSSLSETFKRETAVAFSSFPLSVTVLEKDIRLFLDGNLKNFSTNVTNSSRTPTLRRRLGAMQCRLAQAAGLARTAGVYSDLHIFPGVERTVSDFARQHTLRHYAPSWNSPGKDYLPVSALALAGDAFATCNKLMAERGTLEVLSDRKIMTRLEAQLARNRRALTAALRRKRICGIIVQDDSKPAHRLLSLAARDAGVPMVVMAHGYIQSPCLHSIAPVYANHLVVWSKAQKEMLLCKAPELLQRDVLKCFGFPYERIARDPVPCRVLALLKPITSFKENELRVLIERLSHISHQARKCGLSLCVKPHPKEAGDLVAMQRFDSAGLEIVSGRLQDLLPVSALTLGTDSSGLLESQFMGIPTFHLSQYKTFEFEGVPCIDADNLDVSALVSKKCTSAMVPFREDEFKEFLARAFGLYTPRYKSEASIDLLERERG